MHLFELAKLGMSGTGMVHSAELFRIDQLLGYKLQQQISKDLQHHSAGICTALNHYNKEARALNPPHPMITFKEVINYNILGEFDLL